MANNEFHSHPQVIWPPPFAAVYEEFYCQRDLFGSSSCAGMNTYLNGEGLKREKHKALVFGVRLKEVTFPYTISEAEGGLKHSYRGAWQQSARRWFEDFSTEQTSRIMTITIYLQAQSKPCARPSLRETEIMRRQWSQTARTGSIRESSGVQQVAGLPKQPRN